jgi:extradiol dioxygenase family protein
MNNGTALIGSRVLQSFDNKENIQNNNNKTGNVHVCTYKRYILAHSCNHCCRRKAMRIAYSECVFVALGIQNSMRTHHIVICGLSGCTVFLHIISQTERSSKKKVTKQKICVLIFLQLSSETFLILRIILRDSIINVHGSVVKHPLFLSGFNENRTFSIDFRKILKH